jgi:type II secretory pathway pseudopilin PulG
MSMKAIFGVLSLVVVLAIVGSIAKKQLQAVDGGLAARQAAAASQAAATAADPSMRGGLSAGGAGAVAADPNPSTVPQQSRSMQERARSGTVRALEEGSKRNQQADP